MKTHFIYQTRRISREETLHANEHGRLISCTARWLHGNDKLATLLATLHHLNCAIHIMTNSASITQRANLLTSGGLRGGVGDTSNTQSPAAYGIDFKAAQSGSGSQDPL